MSRKSRLKPHLFTPDLSVPADRNGCGACSTCHLIGKPGDTHHTLPPAPDDDVQLRAAGEKGGEE